VIDRDAVRLDPQLVSIDAREFLALAQSDDIAALERAADLCVGPFLDGLDLDVEGFDEWLATERARMTAAVSLVLETCAIRQDQAGNGAQAVRTAERLVAVDPLRESAQRLLLRILARHRGRDAALNHADDLTDLLHKELATQPEPETISLINHIRHGPLPTAEIRPASSHPAASEAGPIVSAVAASHYSGGASEAAAPARASRARLMRWGAGALAVAGVAVAALFPALTPPARNPDQPGPTQAQRASAGDSWRSPAILPHITAQTSPLTSQGISALAVLPFTAEGADRSPDQRLATRITENLINELSRVPALRVISRQTSRLYAGRPVDVAAVGDELGVRYVVDGSVQLDAERLRINVALVDTSSRLQVWSDRFERHASDLPTVQDEITRGLARRLQVNVVLAEDRRQAPRPDSREPEVGDLVTRGWAAVIRMTSGDRTTGADHYFAEALKHDPDNFSALAGLGAYHVQAVVMFLVPDPQQHIARAEHLLARAIEKNPQSVIAYYYLGTLEKTRGRPHEALGHFVKVIELNPSHAPAHAQIGHVLSRIGRLDDAMEHVRYAVRLSPKDHALGIWSLFGGQIELERGNDAVALEWLVRAVDLTPRSPFAQATLAAAYALTGDTANSAKHAGEVRRLAPWLTPERMMVRLVGLSDPGNGPRRLMEGLGKAFPSAG
jgi:TolB-like protein